MSYLPPNPAILPDGQEVKVHGSEAFPFAVYCGIIPTFIPAYPLHYHEEMELIYCETGSGSITIDRATVTLHTGDVAVILPGQIHAIAAAGAGTFRYYNILFRFSLLERDLPPLFGPAGGRPHGSACPYTKRQPPGQGAACKRKNVD